MDASIPVGPGRISKRQTRKLFVAVAVWTLWCALKFLFGTTVVKFPEAFRAYVSPLAFTLGQIIAAWLVGVAAISLLFFYFTSDGSAIPTDH
jgi:hypothetical protein